MPVVTARVINGLVTIERRDSRILKAIPLDGMR